MAPAGDISVILTQFKQNMKKYSLLLQKTLTSFWGIGIGANKTAFARRTSSLIIRLMTSSRAASLLGK